MKNKNDLLEYLQKLEIKTKTYEHEPLFTVEQSEKVCGDIPGGHCKNLFLKDKKKRFWLVVADSQTKINLRELAKKLKTSSFYFAKEEDLKRILGVGLGSVTPFGLINDEQKQVTVVVQKMLFDYDLLNFHPLTNDATTAISTDDFKLFLEASGNRVEVVDF